ncbi:glycosyltransferase [Actinoplanes sp. NBRC 101535]|uniref:glycosyltransferase n=1 Tax=Actinoplanes sp. NBRC 101535 TaxID=3032196 RepID=UPI0024A1E53A|nr:glycosyltransferase [Actinoplanes sp. NBRC 101535]GLY03755.1 glycosyl transferase [Actinoplanes sp. NBRC 101535]
MRILFTAVPAFGHVLPLLPLAKAARAAGHEVALMTHASMGSAAPSIPLLPGGPSTPEILADVTRRTGGDAMTDMAAFAVEYFVETRLRAGAAEALRAARDFGPDLVVAEMSDYLGQFVAAALGVRWAAHGATLPLIEPLAAQFGARAAERFADHGVTPTAAFAYVDPWPDSLIRDSDRYFAPRIPIRPEPHTGEGAAWVPPVFTGREDRPTALLTLGTVVEDPAVLTRAVAATTALDVNVLLAPHTAEDLDLNKIDPARVRVAGFVPMHDLLAVSDLVVSAAGAGTVLSTLAAGLPMVLLPLGLDKPVNAERAAATGAALVVDDPDEIGAAVAKVLADDTYRASARTVAAEIARTDSPAQVLERLI